MIIRLSCFTRGAVFVKNKADFIRQKLDKAGRKGYNIGVTECRQEYYCLHRAMQIM